MARKQARRRKAKPERNFSLPTVRWKRLLAPAFAIALVVASYQLALHALDREIRSLEISGPFERVSAMQIEAAISAELDAGFLGSNLGRMGRTGRATGPNLHFEVVRNGRRVNPVNFIRETSR